MEREMLGRNGSKGEGGEREREERERHRLIEGGGGIERG